MSSILTRRGSRARTRSRIAASAASTVSGEPTIEWAIRRLTAPSRSRPLETIERATIRDHRRRDGEVRVLGARRGDARFEDLHAQRLVERHHLDAEAAGESRAHALVERLEIGRRAVGGDDDLAAGIEQRVERVAELVLERLALQELHVVDDQQIDRPHRLLEGDRGVRLQRSDEAVHEALGGQIDDAAPLRRRGVRGRLEKMGLAEADRRMDVERAEGGRLSGAVFDHALRGGIGELVGAADQERSESQPTIERRTGERLAVGRQPLRAPRRRATPSPKRRAPRSRARARSPSAGSRESSRQGARPTRPSTSAAQSRPTRRRRSRPRARRECGRCNGPRSSS